MTWIVGHQIELKRNSFLVDLEDMMALLWVAFSNIGMIGYQGVIISGRFYVQKDPHVSFQIENYYACYALLQILHDN